MVTRGLPPVEVPDAAVTFICDRLAGRPLTRKEVVRALRESG
jgi:hypothetical protein